MRTTVLVPVEKVLCDAHIARDGSEEEATETLTLGVRAWDLCVEHNATFARYLVDALGAGVHDTSAEPVPVPVPEPEPEEPATAPVPSVMIAGKCPDMTGRPRAKRSATWGIRWWAVPMGPLCC